MSRIVVATVVASALFVSCAAKEELVAKSADVPTGIDLSGRWQLQAGSRDTARRIHDAESEAAGGNEGIAGVKKRQRKTSRKRSSAGTSVHVFLETGSALKVSQTAFGLFISFDRSVVEEYRFGEKRQVNVGPIVADRVSGWSGSAYIIETLDEQGAKLIETYRLSEDGSRLTRTISIVHEETSHLNVEQVFDRI